MAVLGMGCPASAMLLYSEDFEGDASGYTATNSGGTWEVRNISGPGGAGFTGGGVASGSVFYGNNGVDGELIIPPTSVVVPPGFGSVELTLSLAAAPNEFESGQVDELVISLNGVVVDTFTPDGPSSASLVGAVSGATLGNTFQQLSYIAPVGASNQLALSVEVTGGTERIGFDNISVVAVPEASVALVGTLLSGGIGLFANRRRSR